MASTKRDLSGYFFEKVRNTRIKIQVSFASGYMYLLCWLKGVKVGKNCKFFGLAYIRRTPHCEISIGKNCKFRSSFTSNLVGLNHRCLITTWFNTAKIEIGNNVGMSSTVIGAAKYIKIGDDVMCGGNVFITDFDWHPTNPNARHERADKTAADVVIEDNVWLGMNSVVLKGVTIGKNSVIGANSVVVKDIPPNVIAGGNPCKVLKELIAEPYEIQ